MLELAALAIALVGGFAAGLWDLKTTDIPDEIPALMAVLGLFIWYANWLTTGSWMPLAISATLGTAVFALGWGLYRLGQWGGGDAALLAGIFYLLPNIELLTNFVMNFFIVALTYSVLYSICIGFAHPHVFGYTIDSIKRSKISVAIGVWFAAGLALMACAILLGIDADIGFIGFMWLAAMLIILFYAYARAIERNVFRRSVPVSKLKAGDVLSSSKRWEGITEEEIMQLKRKRVRVVEIKEGVRFGLVFPITLSVTLILGNVMLWLVGLA